MHPNANPKYNAGYTGDLRAVISHLERRLVTSQHHGTTKLDDADSYIGGPIYLVGYSLGANIITKYLGEESLHGTLPKCIGGGAALGNPLHIASNSIPFPWNMILAMGVKKSVLQNLSVYKKHHDRGFQSAVKKALLSRTIGQVDDAFAPYIVRNEGDPPYTTRVGYSNGKEYWHDSSSHRYVGNVSVPLLKVVARDDFLVFGQFASKLNHCLENPNVVVVKTHCGGHLGWQESPPPAKDSKGKEIPSPWFGANRGSWSDVAVADFIEALLYIREDNRKKDEEVIENAKEARMHKIVSRL
ncbi:hypothetical protein HJC23_008948 [Cyclotella cryptica]|uniref:AB hydrolase-1 domain-containing protein n=1 Tax=Cyclotella cryptica TaxID=29204 RepID=A0ABD3Q1L1_9STRA|eukprot:CCRYP_009623-RA/>CCRYP_009623-RA protein AED:0.02 eAED:0.02 QI:1133/1/1/1/1/1/2/72/299